MLPPRVPGLHFVGFRGDEYVRAARIFGRPSIIHIGWDLRARREIAEGDVVVLAKGSHDQAAAERNFSDTTERLP